jgi:hypothetical protein
MLDVPVLGSWQACSLAQPMFSSVWQDAEQEVEALRVIISERESLKTRVVS